MSINQQWTIQLREEDIGNIEPCKVVLVFTNYYLFFASTLSVIRSRSAHVPIVCSAKPDSQKIILVSWPKNGPATNRKVYWSYQVSRNLMEFNTENFCPAGAMSSDMDTSLSDPEPMMQQLHVIWMQNLCRTKQHCWNHYAMTAKEVTP